MAEIEEQHRHISVLIAGLQNASEGDGAGTADILLEHLVDYMLLHFRTEEAVMERFEYPDLRAHRAEHVSCMSSLRDFVADSRARRGLDLAAISRFLTGWLHAHTECSDSRFIEYVANVDRHKPTSMKLNAV